MSALVLAGALFLSQDPSVTELLKRIDGEDPAVCFRTIGTLAELGGKHKSDIEKGAASLPEFYRDALLSDFEASGVPPRVTLKGAGRTADQWIEDLTRQTGLRFGGLVGASTPELFDLNLEGVPAFEALSEICLRSNGSPWWNGNRGNFNLTIQGPLQRGFATRGGALFYLSSYQGRRVFSGQAPASFAGLTFMAASTPGEGLLGWNLLKLYEAVGDNGAPLVLYSMSETGAVSPPMDSWLAEYRRLSSYPWFCLQVSDDIKKIDRLKFSVRVRSATKKCTLEISGPAAEGKGKVSHEGYDLEVTDIESLGPRFGRLRLRIKTDKPELDAMLGMLPVAMFLESDKPNGIGSHWAEPTRINGGVEYLWTWLCAGGAGDAEGPRPNKIRLVIPAATEERTIFAEFRDIPLR